jgi:hypothetical protein
MTSWLAKGLHWFLSCSNDRTADFCFLTRYALLVCNRARSRTALLRRKVVGGDKMPNRCLSHDIWRSTTISQATVTQEDTQEDAFSVIQSTNGKFLTWGWRGVCRRWGHHSVSESREWRRLRWWVCNMSVQREYEYCAVRTNCQFAGWWSRNSVHNLSVSQR